jgi:hypothetical protein
MLRREKINAPGQPPANRAKAMVRKPYLGPSVVIHAVVATPKSDMVMMMVTLVLKESVKNSVPSIPLASDENE